MFCFRGACFIALQRFFDRFEQVVVFFKGGQIGVILFDLLGAAEEKTCLAVKYHTQIVVAVAGRNGFVSDGLQRLDRRQLGLFTSHAVARDLAVLCHLQRVAEDGRHSQLFHQVRE